VILIAYDGSKDSQAAIDLAGKLMDGEPATVLAVWEPFVDVMARTGLGVGPGVIDFEALDKAYEESARELAAEGAQRAERAGTSSAQARSCSARVG
jgi:nucleotide-binding universal stress UspA family protein